jgi:hypothetical protein
MEEERTYSEEELDATVKKLLDKIWATKGARFNAHRRLLGKNSASQFALAVLSIYAIAASVSGLVLPPAKYPKLLPAMNAGTIVASVFILVQGLLESAKDYRLRAHQMLRCGEKLSELYNIISAHRSIKDLSKNSYIDSVHKYSQILADYSENHADIDYHLFIATNKRQDGNKLFHLLNRNFLEVINLFHIWGSSLVYIAAPPIAIFIAIGLFPL